MKVKVNCLGKREPKHSDTYDTQGTFTHHRNTNMGSRGHSKQNIGKVARLDEKSPQLFLAVNSSLFKLYWEWAQSIWFSMKVKVERSF